MYAFCSVMCSYDNKHDKGQSLCSSFYFVYTKVPLLLSSFNIALLSVGLVTSV